MQARRVFKGNNKLFRSFLFRRSRADIILIIVGRLSIFSPALRKFSEKLELTGADEGQSQKL